MTSRIAIIHHGVDDSTDPMIVNAARVRDNLSAAIIELGFKPVPVYIDTLLSGYK